MRFVDEDSAHAATQFANHRIVRADKHRWLLRQPQHGRPEKTARMTPSDGSTAGWSVLLSAEIICGAHRDILVHGDIGLVAFAYGPRDPIQRLWWMGSRPVVDDYVLEKAHIGMSGDALLQCYDEDLATAELLEWAKDEADGNDPNEETAHVVQTLRDAAHRSDLICDHRSLFDHLYDELGYDHIEGRGDIGMRPAWRLYHAHAAIRRLCALLKASP